MKVEHTPLRSELWEIEILPYRDQGLYEDAPHNEDTRAIYQLVEPIRNWLADHTHQLTTDRGDWGDGDEHFYIRLFSADAVASFTELCNTLRDVSTSTQDI